MGLMDKIEDKLHKGKKDDTTTSNEYGNDYSNKHSSTSATHGGTHGTHASAGDDYKSSSGLGSGGVLGSHGNHPTTGNKADYNDYNSNTTSSGMGSGLTSGHNTHGNRDDYNNTTTGSGMGSGLTSGHNAGSNVPSGMSSGHHTGHQTGSGMTGSGMTGSGMTSGHHTSSNAPGYDQVPGVGSHHDPKSGWLEGETGRSHGTHGTHGSSTHDYAGRDGYGTSGSAYDNNSRSGYGQGTGATGPVHNSEMLNKLDPRVDSSQHGSGSQGYGSSNTQTGGFESGPHGRLENRGSIPTAGGAPVGSGGSGPYNDSSRGPVGSEGYGSSHVTGGHHGHHGQHHGTDGPIGTSGMTGSGMTGSSGLTGGSSGLTGGSSGIAPEKKMSGAYEAGYRDAMKHMEAEKR